MKFFQKLTDIRKLSVIPILVLTVFIISILTLNLKTPVFNSPPLLSVLNLIFVTGTFSAIALVSAKSYLVDGSLSILLLGSSALIISLGTLAAQFVAPISINANVTTFNMSVFIASLLLFWSVVANSTRRWANEKKINRLMLIISYLGVIAFVLTLTAFSLANFTPLFFATGGTTVLREFVLAFSIFMFSVSCISFGHRYLQTKSPVLFYYSMGLACFALGLFGVAVVIQFNDLPNWAGRIAQYAGGLYFLIAIWRHDSGIDYQEGLSGSWIDAFGSSHKQFRDLSSKMLNGFAYNKIITDKAGNPIDYVFLEVNDAFKRILGLSKEQVIGKRVTDVLVGIEDDSANWIGTYGYVALTGEPLNFEKYSDLLDKWFNVTAYSTRKGYFVALFEDITERKKVEEQIQSWALFPFENPAAVLRVNREGNLLFANPVAQSFLREWETKIGEKVPEHVRQKVIDALTTGNKVEFEVSLGIEIFSFLVAPIEQEDYANLYGRKITKRKKAEEALKKSEEKYRLLVESPNSIVMTANKDLNITYMNNFGLNFFGYTAEELLGRNVLGTTIPFEDDEGRDLSAMLRDMTQNPEKYKTNVHKNILKNGKLVWVSWTNSFRYDQNDNIEEILAVGNDISNLKETEEKLRESKLWEATSFYTRNLIETSLDPFVTISPGGKITDVNKATEQITGFLREELIGTDFSEYFTEPEKAAAGYKQVFTNGFVTDYPLAIKHKSGKIAEVLYNASVYRNAEGQVQGIFAAARDITKSKSLEKQLKEKEHLAAIGATAGMVGHDIRNPLQAILGDLYLTKQDLEMLPESKQKQSIQENINAIEENVDYINKIVLDLQDYAKLITPVFKQTKLEALIKEIIQKKKVPRNIKLSYNTEKDANIIISDSDLLKRILDNLITNAIQAMPHGGKLSLSVSKNKKDTVITVEDTGIGIPDEVKPRLFTPMVTTKSKGQGFGLAVVKRMTKALGGTVTFDSEIGKGTKFVITLPVKD